MRQLERAAYKPKITKFNAQYPKLSVKTTIVFHDGFLILVKTEFYHIRASIKDVGKIIFFMELNTETNRNGDIPMAED